MLVCALGHGGTGKCVGLCYVLLVAVCMTVQW
jgi:hypothetical protein